MSKKSGNTKGPRVIGRVARTAPATKPRHSPVTGRFVGRVGGTVGSFAKPPERPD